MKINKFLPFAIIYYFFNSFGLPFGLTYTSLLAPLFYWYIVTTRQKDVFLPFFGTFLFFYIGQSFYGVDDKSYLISFLNMSGVYLFCQALYTWLKTGYDPEKVFENLLRLNFVFCLIAIPLYFTQWQDLLWIKQFLTDGFDDFRRLKMFTYEASYYATLTIPLFFFFLLQIVFRQNKIKTPLLLAMIMVPYILSFALGVIACIVLSVVITLVIYARQLTRKRTVFNALLTSLCGLSLIIIIAAIFFPDNPLFVRIGNILSNNDSSGRGRTYEAFEVALEILKQRNSLLGIGPGQMKFLGTEVIRDFYVYPLDMTGMAIPNATAETLAVFGWIGLGIRFFIQIFFFFRAQIWKNYFQLLLFSYIFIYQFTGSFITNIAEYVIWVFAFNNFFPRFDVKNISGRNLVPEQIIAQPSAL